ncbi:TIGR00282 family metallophosphoesterase [bacterium]|nr:TIGR00282 family metallophosphoesterase [bacterium]
MRVLFLGDIVGEAGRKTVRRAVPVLREERQLDLVIANAENIAGGSGMTPKIYAQLRRSGVDACTMGDHIYKKREIIPVLVRDEPICKPANFPPEAPGRDHMIVQTKDGTSVAVISVLGRIFMRPVDCPLAALDRVLSELDKSIKVILVDVHAEATSEKQVIFRYLVGRVSAVVGTHTHVPTADATVASPGTAFISDLGMTGPYESIIGRRIDKVIKTTKTFEPFPFDVATGDPRLSGAIIDIDEVTGRARSIEPIHLDKAAIDIMAGPAATDA